MGLFALANSIKKVSAGCMAVDGAINHDRRQFVLWLDVINRPLASLPVPVWFSQRLIKDLVVASMELYNVSAILLR